MNEQKNKSGRGIFYGVIGVATLVVAIIGATFAYFTATQSAGNNVITGNMASIQFGLQVQKVTKADERLGGMIPMSNTMVESALHGSVVDGESTITKSDASVTSASYTYSKKNICTDDNGNAVCQVYKIVVNNTGSAGMFVDGYVSLTGGSREPTDAGSVTSAGTTTMRWAQAFCEGVDNQLTSCTTAGLTTTGATGISSWGALDGVVGTANDATGYYNEAILPSSGNSLASASTTLGGVITTDGTINGNPYPIISQNYIRISDHNPTSTSYARTTDMTSALVLNQNLAAQKAGQVSFEELDSTSSDNGMTPNADSDDAKVFYIVVWLSETGTNQTPEATGTDPAFTNPAAANFFSGNVTFNSAQGSEVTATFSGYTAVQSDTVRP